MPYDYDFLAGWIIRDRAGYMPDDAVSKATVFALANGYLGSRGAPESAPLDVPGLVGSYINGLYDTPTGGILDREMINLPAWTPIRLEVDGKPLDLTGPELHSYTRALDMRQAVLHQEIHWTTAEGKSITLRSERLVSMARLHLAAIRWEVQADAPCEMVLRSALDGAVSNRFAPDHFASLKVQGDGERSQIGLSTLEKDTRVLVMAAVSLEGAQTEIRSETVGKRIETIYTLRLNAGQTVTLTKFAAVYDSRFSDGDLAALGHSELEAAQVLGYPALRDEHAARWADLWATSDMVIEGDDQAQMAIRFCIFHLLANAPHSDRVSISARGLQGQDYWGSIFWDCDIYVLPFFIYTQPDYARRCLMYRYHTLDGARRKARGLGTQGAYYAWQSQETGDETCALYVFDDPRTGQKIRSYFADEQIHISADVAYAVWQYVQATGDTPFLADYGLEIVCEVARFYASRVTHNAAQDRYELLTVLGPDEYHERVNNNAYTNALARRSFEIALAALEQVRASNEAAYDHLRAKITLGTNEIERWSSICERLYVPEPDPNTGLVEQFDGYGGLEDAPPEIVRTRLAHPDLHPGGPNGPFQATQAIKQADVVLLLYLLRDHYTQAVKTANWHYYEPRTAHDSSLSPMAYALVAAEVGMTDWAYRYFLHTALLDLLGMGPHWNLGVHTAALGGAWLAVVHGFCRLDLRSDTIHAEQSVLPSHWKSVSFRFYWHGQSVRFYARPPAAALKAETGPIVIQHEGSQKSVDAGREFSFVTGRPTGERSDQGKPPTGADTLMETIIPTDGMVIMENTRLAPGVYHLPHGLSIADDDVILDGTGALIVGQDHSASGIHAEGRRDITIRGLSISGYTHGIRLDRCQNATVENVRVRDTAEIEGINTFLYLWTPIENAYGGAILFHEVKGGAIRGCDVQHQQNGILLYHCSDLTVEKNNGSFNSGWGVYLSTSSDSVIQDNRLDFCNRLYRRPEDGSIRVEADAAGIVLVYSSSRNKFLRNSCLCGGDGIFVAGYDHKGRQGPCNDNLFEDNDCRLSPNNAIESTFSRGNIFRRNDCSRSNYGLWMGYSWENVIEDNVIEFNRWAGIAVEHGFDFTIRGNKIRLNGEGVRLWTRGGPVVQHWPGHEVSHHFLLENNLIETNLIGFNGYTGEDRTEDECYGYHLRGNTLRDNRVGVRLARVHDCTLEGNHFIGNVETAVRLESEPGVTVGDNRFEGNTQDVRETIDRWVSESRW